MEAEIDSKASQEIMEDFVEVHKAAGQEVDVGLTLANVNLNLQASAKKYKEFISSFVLTCNNAKAKVSGFVKSLENARDEAKNKVANTWTKQLAKARKGISEAQTNAKTTVTRLEAIHKEMEKTVMDYHVGVVETDNKLNVVKQLRDIIEDELVNPGKSFIQVGKFNEKLQNLQALVKKSGDSMYEPIIATLVSLASEQNFSNQKILAAILKNLKDLETSLTKFKAEKELSMNAGLKILKAQEENLTSQLEDYHHLEQRNVSDVAEANQNIDLLNSDITNLTSEITRKTEEFTAIQHLCDRENEMFKAGSQRIGLIKKDLKEAAQHAVDLH